MGRHKALGTGHQSAGGGVERCMGHAHESISPEVAAFIRAQKMFFVATAPLNGEGLINLSPKGLDTFAVLDERTVAYLDLTGSGIETAAHVQENGRIVLMFCAFDGPPKIVRLHGRGEVIELGTPEFAEMAGAFPPRVGARAIIRVRVRRASVSCGFGVPLMEYRGARTRLDESCRAKGEAGLREYREKKNRVSLEGLRGIGV